jgi:hypothetical protein
MRVLTFIQKETDMAFRRDRRFRRAKLALVLSSFAVVLLLTIPALAQRELLTRPGQKKQVVIDQISGFRGGVAGALNNNTGLVPTMQYYGPIGFGIQRYSQTDAAFAQTSDSVTATTIWFAPSLDVFVIDHLSIGGMVEIAYTSNSGSEAASPSRSTSVSLPSNTSFAILPRVGWMFALPGDRWAIWPRLGAGYVSSAIGSTPVAPGSATSTGGGSIYGFALDFDIGVLFRVNETFFLRLAPEVGSIPAGGNSTQQAKGGGSETVTTNADYLQFTLTGGIGVMFDL